MMMMMNGVDMNSKLQHTLLRCLVVQRDYAIVLMLFTPSDVLWKNKAGYTAQDAPSMRTFHLQK